ncbi:MAG: ABC transporter ATP-binding protein [Hyphomicrobiales bacterium]|nr:ABC transporter ATP-binding protein [Hyphomicrobiales bacterium]
MGEKLLTVRGLKTHFFNADGVTRAVDGVSFEVAAGETLGIVGESGCGKSVTALSVMRLLPEKSARIVEGSILFEGRDLAALDERTMRSIRGNRIAMIFQEPMTSLNPLLRVGEQIAEALRIHTGADWRTARQKAARMLKLVRIPDAEKRLDDYPHQFSGGMRQRVMIAMALACDPRLLIADEPTTALDVTIQAQILGLIRRLASERHVAVLLTTHDLGAAYEICDSINVMYAGQDVESAPVDRFFAQPAHPYTTKLLASLPRDDGIASGIPGEVPRLIGPPGGCRFNPRCERADGPCREVRPPVEQIEAGHWVRCYHPHRGAP